MNHCKYCYFTYFYQKFYTTCTIILIIVLQLIHTDGTIISHEGFYLLTDGLSQPGMFLLKQEYTWYAAFHGIQSNPQ